MLIYSLNFSEIQKDSASKAKTEAEEGNIKHNDSDKNNILESVAKVSKLINLDGYRLAGMLLKYGSSFLSSYFKNKNNEEFNKKWHELISYSNKLNNELEVEFENTPLEELDKNISDIVQKEIKDILNEEMNDAIDYYITHFLTKDVIEENLKIIDKLNILIVGERQIGKSTLIVKILGLEDREEEIVGGKGESKTMNDTLYSSERIKHLQIIDTRGFQPTDFNFDEWLKIYKIKMENNTNSGNFKDLIHGIWYCVSGDTIDDSELIKIKEINKLFYGYKVPIIFIYLKPKDKKQIETMKKRLEKFGLINETNWVVVQSKDYDLNILDQIIKIKQCNVDKLLYMTKNISLNGIFNSAAGRIKSQIKEEIEKLFDKRLNKKYAEIKYSISNIEYYFKKMKFNETSILDNITKLREKIIKDIYVLMEETLFASENHLKEISKSQIKSLQKMIETRYQRVSTQIAINVVKNNYFFFKNLKKLYFNEQNQKSWFGCDEKQSDFSEEDELLIIVDLISKGYTEIIAMKKSFKILVENLKLHIFKKLSEETDKIIKNKELNLKLENTIKEATNSISEKLNNSLDKEIKHAFPNKNNC